MKIHYSLDSAVALDPSREELLLIMKVAGVDQFWLHGYFFGHMATPIPEMIQAKERLEAFGFEVAVINVPIGHPGNSANPDDPTLDFSLPVSWRYRIDRLGNPVYFCADIEAVMIEESAAAMHELKAAGFTQVLMDDDLRQGNWGAEIEGCYCEYCLAEFNEGWQHNETRESLGQRLDSIEITTELQDWVAFQCSKVTQYMSAMAIPGIELGTMVMADGDERHGLDLAEIQAAVPDCFFRVGEHQFNDDTFGNPNGKSWEYISTLKHLNRIPRDKAYSETTVFPDRALTAENLVYKAKMALALGIPNIMVMSGLCVIQADYWAVWTEALDDMKKMDEQCYPTERVYPVHLLYGTHGVYQEPLYPSPLPVLSGLPVKPVRADESDGTGEILCVFGDYRLGEEWERHLSGYKQIILDLAAAKRNPDKVNNPQYPQILAWQHEVGAGTPLEEISLLRTLVVDHSWDFPWLSEGGQVGLVWLKEIQSVILFNMEEIISESVLMYKGAQRPLTLQPLSFQIVKL